MSDNKFLNRRLETIGWGAFFVLIGADFFVPGLLLPYGIGVLGFGLILLSLNLARSLNHIAARGFTTLVGLLALVEGGVAVARALWGIKIDLPFLAVFLIGIGIYILARSITRTKNRSVRAPE